MLLLALPKIVYFSCKRLYMRALYRLLSSINCFRLPSCESNLLLYWNIYPRDHSYIYSMSEIPDTFIGELLFFARSSRGCEPRANRARIPDLKRSWRDICISDHRDCSERSQSNAARHRLRYPKPFTYRVSFDLGVSARSGGCGPIFARILVGVAQTRLRNEGLLCILGSRR